MDSAAPNAPHSNSHHTSPTAEGDGGDEEDSSLDAFRRRAISEVVRQSTGKWRLVAAFSSLRKSWEKNVSPPPPGNSAKALTDTIGDSDMEDSCESFAQVKRGGVEGRNSGVANETKPRRRVSLFLRRRGRFRDGNSPQSAYIPPEGGGTDDDVATQQQFRRAQSHFEKPVSYNDECGPVRGGEGGRYLAYAAEFDSAEFEKKRNALRKLRPAAIRLAAKPTGGSETNRKPPTKPENGGGGGGGGGGGSVKDLAELFGGMKTADGEIVGEICLEDFADDDDNEDFDFLDGQIVDVCDGGSLRLDGQQINIFGEEEFAAFCKEVGLDQLLEHPKPSVEEWKTFQVGDSMMGQWKDDARIHNRFVARWNEDVVLLPADDVRALAKSVK